MAFKFFFFFRNTCKGYTLTVISICGGMLEVEVVQVDLQASVSSWQMMFLNCMSCKDSVVQPCDGCQA